MPTHRRDRLISMSMGGWGGEGLSGGWVYTLAASLITGPE